MLKISRTIGGFLAAYLSKPRPSYELHQNNSMEDIFAVIKPGDILLVDGNSHISTAIKYITQSTWSHSSFYIGSDGDTLEQAMLLEADLNNGVTLVPLTKYAQYNVRICRPVGITEKEREALLQFVKERVGFRYDLKNIFDLMRYLIQKPAVPNRYRRHLLTLGSGEPTKAICSTLIAQAFQSINYPIMPRELFHQDTEELQYVHRDSSHTVPRDFDLSPYFRVVKPTLELGFDFHKFNWREDKVRQEGLGQAQRA